MRRFVGVDFMAEAAPDGSTLLKFRHLPEEHKIGEKIFADVRNRLDRAGLMMHGGTIVDAAIINAPSSTKTAAGKRDPGMHQAKKGKIARVATIPGNRNAPIWICHANFTRPGDAAT